MNGKKGGEIIGYVPPPRRKRKRGGGGGRKEKGEHGPNAHVILPCQERKKGGGGKEKTRSVIKSTAIERHHWKKKKKKKTLGERKPKTPPRSSVGSFFKKGEKKRGPQGQSTPGIHGKTFFCSEKEKKKAMVNAHAFQSVPQKEKGKRGSRSFGKPQLVTRLRTERGKKGFREILH